MPEWEASLGPEATRLSLGLLGVMGLRGGPAALWPAGCPKSGVRPTAQSSVFCLFFLLPLCLCLPELSPINWSIHAKVLSLKPLVANRSVLIKAADVADGGAPKLRSL